MEQLLPFQMSFVEETDLEQGKQNFKYNGKELDKTHGLNQYDYAARFMDPSMIRFTTVDPLAEKYYSISPYVYVANNPMNATDPRGDSIWFYY
ncbi:MAG: RHS repeat-associated core domain-containing protein [Dysgonomonas sp.]|uniref:RHS repeat domain-containing protein n=1 Tax=Dysgonomonas sp. TaxID=1891233 RepID=UPI0039E6467C